jgi:hypothetical protein
MAESLEEVLAAAGPAHHAAFVETDGDDPDWPLWYAEHTLEEVRALLGLSDLTLSRLTWAFVGAADAHASDPSTPWPAAYAAWFERELPGT